MFTGGLDIFGRKERERAKELQRLLEEEERQAREREKKLREMEEPQKTSLFFIYRATTDRYIFSIHDALPISPAWFER